MSFSSFRTTFLSLRNVILTPSRSLNANTATVVKAKRAIYPRTYPTSLVAPDGSSTIIRYHEPRRIIKLPLDLSTVTEADRKDILERRKPKKKVKIVEHIEDTYDATKYLSRKKK